MKTLHLFLCALATSAAAQTDVRGPQPRDVEIIRPLTTNLFFRATNAPSSRGRTDPFAVGPSTNRLNAPVRAGRSTNLHTLTLTNRGAGTPSRGLIGPVFPATRDTTLSPTGRPGGDVLVPGAVGPTGVPFLTNSVGTGPGFAPLQETTAPGSSVPQPSGSPPLAPPTAPNPPGATPNSPLTVPGSITPPP